MRIVRIRIKNARLPLILTFLVTYLVVIGSGLTYSQVAYSETFGPLDYSIPWDWPDSDVVANNLFAAKLMEQKRGGLLEINGIDVLSGEQGNGGPSDAGGMCSPGSTQSVFNCIINNNVVQLEGSQLTNVDLKNKNNSTDNTQKNLDNTNELNMTTP